MKKHRLLFSVIYLIATYLLFLIGLNRISSLHFSYDLLFIFTLCDVFILLHFILDIKKMYDFIYHKRYLLGFILLAILVIFKYNGSSISLWNNYVEPQYKVNDSIILGVPRPIRSDEWLVGTTVNYSQRNNNFNSINSFLGAKDNLVMLYPNLPSKDISILATPQNIGFLFLDNERGLSLSWYFNYFVLFFATFEMFMIFTKKNKLYSLLGSILITFSPVVGWWQSCNIMAYGALAVDLFYYFLCANNWKKKLIISIIFGYVGFLYIMCMYPAWQVAYGYCYLIILLYILYDNKNKFKLKDCIYLIPVFLTLLTPLIILLSKNKDILNIVNNTAYPGQRFSVGGGEYRLLFSYVSNIFFPYLKLGNPCELSAYISLFPLPTILGIYLIYKNKKIDWFLLGSSLIVIALTLWVMFPWPSILSKLTLLSMTTEIRVQVAIGYMSIIELIYILSNYSINDKIDLKKKIILFLISMLMSLIFTRISFTVIKELDGFSISLKLNIISFILFSIIYYLVLINNKKTHLILILLLILISFVSSIFIAPLNKGAKIYDDKPISNEIKKLVSQNENAIFMVTDSDFILPNYFAANGAKMINTTNFVPNLDLYRKLDPNGLYEDIYNRYEHVAIELVDEETSFVLKYQDSIAIKLNYNDVCKINVDYLITNSSDVKYKKYKKIYGFYGTSIYETGC